MGEGRRGSGRLAVFECPSTFQLEILGTGHVNKWLSQSQMPLDLIQNFHYTILQHKRLFFRSTSFTAIMSERVSTTLDYCTSEAVVRDDTELSDLGVETISSPTTYSLRVLCKARFELSTGRRSFNSSRFLKPSIVGCHPECSPLSSHIRKVCLVNAVMPPKFYLRRA